MEHQRLLLGNEAISRGLLEYGCQIATAYPGTPSSEILSSLARFKKEAGIRLHTQWSVNEKVAFEIAYAGSQAGLRAAVAMKQVGLNVAADPLMSAAYIGTKGGFLVISADDPGPHSSQTEQDSRLQAMMAKIPVLDPDSPQQARALIKLGFDLSESFEIPVKTSFLAKSPRHPSRRALQRIPCVGRQPLSFAINSMKPSRPS